MDSTDPHLDRPARVFGLGFVLDFEQRVLGDPVEASVGEENLRRAIPTAADEVAVENRSSWLRVVPLGLTRPLQLNTPFQAEKLTDPGKLAGTRSGEGEKTKPGAVGLGLRHGPTIREVVFTGKLELSRSLPQFSSEILRQDLGFGLGFGQFGSFDRLSSERFGREIETLVCKEDQTGGDNPGNHDGDDPPNVREFDDIMPSSRTEN